MDDTFEPLTLYIGNYTYSSWSMRAGLVLDRSGLDYDTITIRMREPGFEEKLAQASPGKTVPALHHGDLVLSETLAIAEYVAELAPEAALWPKDRIERARARMLAVRMATGFNALKSNCPMNLSNRFDNWTFTEGTLADIADLEAIWRAFLKRPGSSGPYLFGDRLGIADAFFAPIAMRIYTFRIPISLDVQAYLDTLMKDQSVRRWIEAAASEAPRTEALAGKYATGGQTPGDFPILHA